MNNFSLKNKNIIITGGGGYLAKNFIDEIVFYNGNPILIDKNSKALKKTKIFIKKKYNINVDCKICDLSIENDVKETFKDIKNSYGVADGLINNAAYNPEVSKFKNIENNSFEKFSLESWNRHIEVGLSSAFMCTKYFALSSSTKKRSIINISSDLGLIAPNQSLYDYGKYKTYKPVSYSVIKHGIIGLTKYSSTYFLKKNIRCNALALGGVFKNQNKLFLKKIKELIPLGRMAKQNEYNSAIIFLLSDASSYMNGSVMTIDGGRTAW